MSEARWRQVARCLHFATAVAATPKGTDPSLENDRSATGQLEQGSTVLRSTESRHTTGDRGATLGALCIFCGLAPENSGGDSEVGCMWTTNTCAHREFVHASGMLDRAKRRRVWAYILSAMSCVSL